jgi:pyruvate/2-oxoglutarate dehydrogenase complex dihydrolipoamide dehydrogenase (E3) component
VESGVDVYFGKASFADKQTVSVAARNKENSRTLTFNRAAIATGSRPRVLPIEGLAEAGFLTNETVFSLTERPGRLVVIGGGPLGCELAQAFNRLGSEVTIIEAGPHIMGKEDADAAEVLLGVLEREGINVLKNSKVSKVEITEDEKRLHVSGGDQATVLSADEVLLGAGRQPNIEELNLDAAGVAYDEHHGVTVNDYLQTSNPRIYAAGDVCLKYKFTHTADASARIVVQNALFWGFKKKSKWTVPWCTYTSPEVAHTGLSDSEAERRKIPYQSYAKKLDEVDRAVIDGQSEGFLKVTVREGTDKILGAVMIAEHAGETISEITLAINNGIGLKRLGETIHPYPTQAEVIKGVSDEFNRSRLTPRLKRLSRKLMAWRR